MHNIMEFIVIVSIMFKHLFYFTSHSLSIDSNPNKKEMARLKQKYASLRNVSIQKCKVECQ